MLAALCVALKGLCHLKQMHQHLKWFDLLKGNVLAGLFLSEYVSSWMIALFVSRLDKGHC